MPKTKALVFTCVNALIETHTDSLLSIAVKEPNLSDILDGIHEEDVKNWARGYKNPSDLFEPKAVVKWVKDEYQPEEIFNADELEGWAEANGFTKKAP
jgi:hypothetical protein